MNERKRVFLLIGVMAAVALVVAAAAIFLLYRAAFHEEEKRLTEIAQGQARILEEIYRFHLEIEKTPSSFISRGAFQDTLDLFVAAHNQYVSASQTGEITLANRQGNQIVFLLRSRHGYLYQPEPVPFESKLAEPMRRALSGESGTVKGLDYAGTTVLAEHEPIRSMNLGIVAKVDLAEVRAPFIEAGAIALGLGILLVLVGTWFFMRLTSPILRRLEDHAQQMEASTNSLLESEQRLRTIIDSSVDAILVVGREGIARFANPAAEILLGRTSEELVGEEVGIPLSGEGGADIEIFRRGGEPVFAELRIAEIEWEGEPCFLVSLRDTTERKKSEERIRHLNSVLSAVRNVNQLITREKDRGRLIQRACETLVETRGFNTAWIALLDEAGRPCLAAEAGIGEPFSEFKKRLEEGGLPPCAEKTFAHSDVTLIEDALAECEGCPLAAPTEGKTRISVRLEYGGKIYGLLASSVPQIFSKDAEERALFEEVAGDIAFALHNIEQEEARQEAARTIFEREERLRAIFQAAEGVSFIMTDLAGKEARIAEFSPGAERAFGYTREEVVGKPAAMLHQPGSVVRFPEVIEALQQGRPQWSGETTLVRKSGETFPALFSIHPLRDPNGVMTALLSVSIDISEQKKAEERLKESEEMFRTLFDYAPDAFYLIDFEGKFIDGNQAAQNLIGYTPEELVGKNFMEMDLMPPEELEKAATLFLRNLQGQPTGPDEYVLKRKDKKLIFAEMRTIPIKIRGRDVVLGIARDITERKELEQQLQQAQRLEVVGRLSGGIAHDFNNLMTTVIGNAELILMSVSESDPVREDVLEIKKAGERAASLTHQLLAFSRRQVLQPKILDLNSVVQEMDRMLRRVIGEDIDLETDLSPDLGHVEVDPGQVEQILMNLAVNARDAMPEGGKLTIETENIELGEEYARSHVAVTPGSYVMLAVSDNGMGMTRDVQAQIFEPFFTTKDLGKGTGLGLATVYGIVKQSGGNIWVYSEPGEGATFKIYLPRVEKMASGPERSETAVETLRSSETILLVEDDEMLRNTAIKILKGQGYHVLAASDGREALDLCQEHDGVIHLLLTDVVMPVMGGLDLSNQAKRLRPNLKMVFMSGYTDNAIVHRGVLDKGVAFLQKPFTPERLARKLREVLAQRPA